MNRCATDSPGIVARKWSGTHHSARTFDGGRLPIPLLLDLNRPRLVEVNRLRLEIVCLNVHAFSIRQPPASGRADQARRLAGATANERERVGGKGNVHLKE
jgi:hypothetical protein